MNQEENDSIWKILKDYQFLFEDIDPNNWTKEAEYSIDIIPGTKPIYTKIYRFPKIQEEEVKTQTTKLLTNGIIKENNSLWNRPL